MNDQALVLYETPVEGVARITLNRANAKNAQNLNLLDALDELFTRAMKDEDVRVIILAAAGSDFSAGHDLRKLLDTEDATRFGDRSSSGNYNSPDGEGYMAREEDAYMHLCKRWRNLSKPTIAQVQGRCIAGGLMLAWVCDLIIASEDAQFLDPVVAWGGNGVEYFAHPWEFGPRKAKELLFTGDTFSADEAWRLGMVNRVVPRKELEAFTLDLAARIAKKPSFALKTVKQSVNAAVDAQGQPQALDTAFQIHHLTHYHNRAINDGNLVDPSVMPKMFKK
ncbi:MAG: enoyl-CoA hydratase [Novosphingobium sp.]|nr:enoyl-CoA hydratase [Novosphingobium sp.]